MNDKMERIKVLALDVDGVLTDGRIVYNSLGHEIKSFDVQDGYGIILWRRLGLKTAILSARSAKPVDIRAQDLKIDRIYQNAYPKIDTYETLLADFEVGDENVCFIGDDLPDLAVLKRAGFSVAVANANQEIKTVVDHVTEKPGGRGAVREVIEMILKHQGRWQDVIHMHE